MFNLSYVMRPHDPACLLLLQHGVNAAWSREALLWFRTTPVDVLGLRAPWGTSRVALGHHQSSHSGRENPRPAVL